MIEGVVQFLVLQGRPSGKRLTFPVGEYFFGRGSECHVRPNSDWVSRQHCLLRVTTEGAYLVDLGSRNGTLVNGIRIRDEHLLAHGDLVQVGPLVFEVSTQPSATGELATQAIDLGVPGSKEATGRAGSTAQQPPPFPPQDQTQQKPE